MINQLAWKTSDIERTSPQYDKTKQTLHSSTCRIEKAEQLVPIVNQCIEKAACLLAENLTDESRYLMFEWQQDKKELTIVVTDDSKLNDSQHIVKCQFTQFDCLDSDNEFAQNMRESIHNYLTTCSEFMRYSLIAAFHVDSRQNSILL